MRLSTFSMTAIALVSAAATLHAGTLINENFDELTPQLTVTSVGAFTAIFGTNVDIVGPANNYGYLCAGPESGNCIDMDGTGGDPQGQLQSNQLFQAGTYDLSFDLVGNERGGTSSVTVNFGDYDQTFVLTSGDVTDGIIINQAVTVSTPGYLFFTSDDSPGDEQGAALDNVVVSTTNSVGVTPEPSSFLLLGTGLLSVAGMLRKRFV